MLANDSIAYGQAQPSAFARRFGRKERVEDVFKVLGRNGAAAVGYLEFNPFAVLPVDRSSTNGQSSTIRHGVYGI